MEAAFFDLDGTLITGNSAWLWMQSERRAGRLSVGLMARGLAYIFAYKLGFIDMEQAVTEALQTVEGLTEDELRIRTRAWFDEYVVPLFAPGAVRTIERQRREGRRLVLLTSASVYESEAVVEHLGLDDFLATRYEVLGGRLTGRPLLPLCYGEGKVVWARKYADEHGIDLKESWFYTDSITDLPMLEAVGHPVVVNPDLRLRRVATHRGWPLEDWSKDG